MNTLSSWHFLLFSHYKNNEKHKRCSVLKQTCSVLKKHVPARACWKNMFCFENNMFCFEKACSVLKNNVLCVYLIVHIALFMCYVWICIDLYGFYIIIVLLMCVFMFLNIFFIIFTYCIKLHYIYIYIYCLMCVNDIIYI